MNYPFDWPSAFEKAWNGNRIMLDEHMNKAKDLILLPLLGAKTRSKIDAEEICSMVITKFWERFFVKEEPLPRNINGYLYTMANNAYFHFSKMKDKDVKRYVELDDVKMNQVFEESPNIETIDSENVHQEKERLLTALEQAIKQLGDKCQKLIQMFVFENKRMKDIYKILGIPSANAATKKKESCINKLKKLMYNEIHNNKI